MAEEYKTIVLNSREYQLNEYFTNLNDKDLAIAIRDFIEEAIVGNDICTETDDIAAAVNRIYPVIANIVFNSNFAEVRHNFRLFNEIINFVVTRLA